MTIHLIVMPITAENIEWVATHYPYYMNPQLSEKRQKNYLLSRSLLSFVLSHLFNIPKIPKIEYGVHGKPFFNDDIPISFNISHTDRSIALLIGDVAPLGVDIETIKTRRNFKGLEKRTFTTLEKRWLHTQDDYPSSFFLLWSLKEAYLKALGTGLSGLSSIEIDPFQSIIQGPIRKGRMKSIILPSNESLCIFIPKDDLKINCYEFKQSLVPLTIPWSREFITYHP